ncbi:hypothetical protein ACIXSW_13730 [Bacteroides fragilis]
MAEIFFNLNFPYQPNSFFLWSNQTLKKIYQTDFKEREWQYITKVLNLQERKKERKKESENKIYK